MTAMEAYITADLLLTRRGLDGAEARIGQMLSRAEGLGDRSAAEEWVEIRRALRQMRQAAR